LSTKKNCAYLDEYIPVVDVQHIVLGYLYDWQEKENVYSSQQATKALAFSSDGQFFAAGSESGELKLWAYKDNSYKLIEERVFDAQINSVAFSPNGFRIAVGVENNFIYILSEIQEKKLALFEKVKADSSVYSVLFSPEGKYLAAVSTDKIVKIWQQTAPGFVFRQKLSPDPKTKYISIAFAPEGNLLAAGRGNKTIEIWQYTNLKFKLIQTLSGHNNHVRSLAFSPDGSYLASASYDRALKLWELQGELFSHVQTVDAHMGAIYQIAFYADGKCIALSSNDGTVKMIEFENNNVKFTKTIQTNDFGPIAISSNKAYLAFCFNKFFIKFYKNSCNELLTKQKANGKLREIIIYE